MNRFDLDVAPDEDADLARIRRSSLAAYGTQRRSRKRLRIGAAAVSAVLVGGAITAGAVAVAQAPREAIANSVACYETASLSSKRADVGQATEAYDATGKKVLQPAPDLLEMCQLMWRSGSLGDVVPAADPNKGTYPVPRLALCKAPNGVAAGFPNRDTRLSAKDLCGRVGLAVWPGQ
jgi:hypothetical protein